MVVGNVKDLEGIKINNPEAKDALMKVLVSPKEGWEGYVMRLFELKPKGYTPKHNHPWPHINFIIEGQGELMIEDKKHMVKAGSYAYVPDDALHQFRNTGETDFKFICIVPKKGHKF